MQFHSFTTSVVPIIRSSTLQSDFAWSPELPSVMGWGTFILGRALRAKGKNYAAERVRTQKRHNENIQYLSYIENLTLKRLEEIPVEERRNNYHKIRREVMRIDKILNDPIFLLRVTQRATSQSLRGEVVDLKAIEEAELQRALEAHRRKFRVLGQSLLWLFFPYYPLWKFIQKTRLRP